MPVFHILLTERSTLSKSSMSMLSFMENEELSLSVRDKVKKNASQILNGHKLNKSRMLPVDDNFGGKIFDRGRVEEYISSNCTPAVSGSSVHISGESVHEFASNFMAKFMVSGDDMCGAASASASASAEICAHSESHQCYAQVRIIEKVAIVKLPDSSAHFDQLRLLMDDETRVYLDGCSDEETAKKIVADVGPYFIDQSTFGATIVMTASSKNSENISSSDLAVSLQAKVASVAKVSANCGLGEQEKEAEKGIHFSHNNYGGGESPHYAGDIGEWVSAAALTNPVVVHYNTTPIYELVEKPSLARALLEQAVLHCQRKFNAVCHEGNLSSLQDQCRRICRLASGVTCAKRVGENFDTLFYILRDDSFCLTRQQKVLSVLPAIFSDAKNLLTNLSSRSPMKKLTTSEKATNELKDLCRRVADVILDARMQREENNAEDRNMAKAIERAREEKVEKIASREDQIVKTESELVSRECELLSGEDEVARLMDEITWREREVTAKEENVLSREREILSTEYELTKKMDEVVAEVAAKEELHEEILLRIEGEITEGKDELKRILDTMAVQKREVTFHDERLLIIKGEIAAREEELTVIMDTVAAREKRASAREKLHEEQLLRIEREISARNDEMTRKIDAMAAREREVSAREREVSAREKLHEEELLRIEREIAARNDKMTRKRKEEEVENEENVLDALAFKLKAIGAGYRSLDDVLCRLECRQCKQSHKRLLVWAREYKCGNRVALINYLRLESENDKHCKALKDVYEDAILSVNALSKF